jgi:hypothetical protein
VDDHLVARLRFGSPAADGLEGLDCRARPGVIASDGDMDFAGGGGARQEDQPNGQQEPTRIEGHHHKTFP